MEYFDSHAHLSASEILPLLPEVMQRARQANVSRILNICTDPLTLKEGIKLAEHYEGIQNAGATTPHDVEREGEAVFPLFAEAAHAKKLVAIGETGLDYYYSELDREKQKQFLRRYLRLAFECKLPVIFHCREAFSDLFAICDAEGVSFPAVLHCFTGSLEEAEGVLQRGWYLSLSGIVTFKKSEALREVARMAPLSQLLIETDAPYLAPQSHRGKQNEPSYVIETARCIAQVKGISVAEVAEKTFQNGNRLFPC